MITTFTFTAQVVFTALYLVAAYLYLKYFFSVERRCGLLAARMLVAGLVVHLAALAVRIAHLGYLPIATLCDALSFAGFIIALAYVCIEKFSRDLSMGAFVAPIICVAQVIGLLWFHPSGDLPARYRSHWFEIHVSSSMFAFASFAIATIGAVLYLVLYRELHRKRPGRFYSRLTSLEQLDRVNFYGSLLGVILLTVAIFTGFNWMREIRASADLRLDARIIATWFTLAVYLTGLLVRRITRASGRTLSLLSIAGFILVILAFAFEGISH